MIFVIVNLNENLYDSMLSTIEVSLKFYLQIRCQVYPFKLNIFFFTNHSISGLNSWLSREKRIS